MSTGRREIGEVGDQGVSRRSAGGRVRLTFPGGTSIPACRICGDRADLVVEPSPVSYTRYAYCARCVDRALEREELRP